MNGRTQKHLIRLLLKWHKLGEILLKRPDGGNRHRKRVLVKLRNPKAGNGNFLSVLTRSVCSVAGACSNTDATASATV